MARACLVVLLCSLVIPIVVAQSTERSHRADIVRFLEQRLEAHQDLDIAADSTVLTGSVLHLKGHVRIVCGSDVFILVDAASIDAAAGKVELLGNLSISRGSRAARIERW